MAFGSLRRLPVEHPPGPLRGYKLAYPMLSADGCQAGFGGIWPSGQAVYRLQDTAVCFWNHRHSPPKRRCSCGFYCLHSVDSARSMACQDEYRSTVILEVEVGGRFVRYEEGFRYSRQRVLAVRTPRCKCGRPACELVDSGGGTRGWLRLQPCCPVCRGSKEPMTLTSFGALLGDPGLVAADAPGTETPATSAVGGVVGADGDTAGSSLSVLAAEIALLQARLDGLEAEVARLID